MRKILKGSVGEPRGSGRQGAGAWRGPSTTTTTIMGKRRKGLVSLEAAPYSGESSSQEMTLEGLAWGHESI